MIKNQKIAIVFLLVVVIIIFILGVIMGAFWTGRSSDNNSSLSTNLLDAEFILTATASGKVKAISNKSITLEQQGHEQVISVRENAQILSSLMEVDPVTGNLTSSAPIETDFNAIKINDLISITLVKDNSGKLVVDKIYIFMSEGV